MTLIIRIKSISGVWDTYFELTTHFNRESHIHYSHRKIFQARLSFCILSTFKHDWGTFQIYKFSPFNPYLEEGIKLSVSL